MSVGAGCQTARRFLTQIASGLFVPIWGVGGMKRVFASRVAFAPDFFGHFVVQFRSVCWCIFSYVHHHFSAETLSRCIQKIGPRQGATQLESFAQRFKATEYSSQRLFLGTSAEFFWGRSGLHSSIHIYTLFIQSLIFDCHWSLFVVYALLIHCSHIVLHCWYYTWFRHVLILCICHVRRYAYVYELDGHRHSIFSFPEKTTSKKRLFSCAPSIPSTCAKLSLANCRRFGVKSQHNTMCYQHAWWTSRP